MPTMSEGESLTSSSIDLFHRRIIAKGGSRNTAKAYATDLRMLLRYHGTDSIPLPLLEEKAEDWLNDTRFTDAASTISRRRVSIRRFGKWAGMVVLDEYRTPPEPKRPPTPLPGLENDLEAMLTESRDPLDKALVGMLGYGGARIGEAVAARPSHFDMGERLWTIKGKGEKVRVVPISASCWSAISSAYVHALAEGEDAPLLGFGSKAGWKRVAAMGRRAEIKRHVKPHDLRHTFATVVLNKTGNIRLVQELLGHESITTTQGYTGVSIADLRGIVEF